MNFSQSFILSFQGVLCNIHIARRKANETNTKIMGYKFIIMVVL